MKGELMLKTLDVIGDIAVSLSDVVLAIMSSGYGASYKKIERELSKIQSDKTTAQMIFEKDTETKRRYEKFIAYLKRDGLIEIKKTGFQKMVSVTSKGKKKLKELKEKERNVFPSTNRYHSLQKNGNPIIIIFDIPEKERKKRAWLREAIRNLGFKMIQRSVWIGNIKIPQLLLKDIKHLRIVPYIEILEITKKGSLEEIRG